MCLCAMAMGLQVIRLDHTNDQTRQTAAVSAGGVDGGPVACGHVRSDHGGPRELFRRAADVIYEP